MNSALPLNEGMDLFICKSRIRTNVE
uniref:Uncharacterized protein n=1 Tax=Anguilla anguilla TaxID=7936 RepID=A0A0E9TZU2_ANGAN